MSRMRAEFFRKECFSESRQPTREPRVPQKLLRCERGDDFFKAGIAAERIPVRTQTQITVAWAGWDFRKSLELVNSQVAFSSPSTDHRINIKHVHAIQGIFRHGRKLECSATFAQRLFFSPKASIDQT